MIARIKNLRLRAILGVFDWEREKKQDIIINVKIEFDGTAAAASDDIDKTVDYKRIKQSIIKLVESSECKLIETLVDRICDLVLENQLVSSVTAEVDKPHALRFADSVSLSTTKSRTA